MHPRECTSSPIELRPGVVHVLNYIWFWSLTEEEVVVDSGREGVETGVETAEQEVGHVLQQQQVELGLPQVFVEDNSKKAVQVYQHSSKCKERLITNKRMKLARVQGLGCEALENWEIFGNDFNYRD